MWKTELTEAEGRMRLSITCASGIGKLENEIVVRGSEFQLGMTKALWSSI